MEKKWSWPTGTKNAIKDLRIVGILAESRTKHSRIHIEIVIADLRIHKQGVLEHLH